MGSIKLKLASKTKNKFYSSNMYLTYLESKNSEVSVSLVRFTVFPFTKKVMNILLQGVCLFV